MSAQEDYYNRFGKEFEEQILSCPEPHLWTTDYATKGRIYQEIRERIEQQQQLIDKYFSSKLPVLDVGCGFGRQAFALAKKGFLVTGTDTSEVFVAIAQKLFQHHGLSGHFICTDVMNDATIPPFDQVVLFDVLEHIPPSLRKGFVQRLADLTNENGRLIMSLPQVKQKLTSQVNNNIRKRLTQHLAYFRNREEHPYPIPQQHHINKLTGKQFHLLEEVATPLTAYYVFERR